MTAALVCQILGRHWLDFSTENTCFIMKRSHLFWKLHRPLSHGPFVAGLSDAGTQGRPLGTSSQVQSCPGRPGWCPARLPDQGAQGPGATVLWPRTHKRVRPGPIYVPGRCTATNRQPLERHVRPLPRSWPGFLVQPGPSLRGQSGKPRRRHFWGRGRARPGPSGHSTELGVPQRHQGEPLWNLG